MATMQQQGPTAEGESMTQQDGEQGFLLVGVIVMIALVLILLSVAAPIVAKDLRREKEVEAVHRGQEYTHAVRMFYKKFNTYPASMEALEKTNNIRYLRKRYVDPLTGKDDWRTIPFGQAKTTVKGFFGAPLAGLGGGPGLGSASGFASSQQPGGGGFGGQSGTVGAGAGTTVGGAAGGAGTTGTGTTGTGTDSGTTGSGSSGFGSSSFGSSNSSSSSSSNPLSGGAGPFVGVGIKKDGPSIITLNEQTDYSTWEFIYDPRIEQLLAKVSLFGGGVASQSSGSLGSASGLSSTPGSSGSLPGFGSSTGGTTSGGTSSGGSTSPSTPPTPPPQ